MAKQNDDDIQVVTLRDVRLSFPSLWEPTSSVEGGKLKYRADFIIDPDSKTGKKNINAIEDAIDFIEHETWGKQMKFKSGRLCYGEGNDRENAEGEVYGGYQDMMYLSASRDKPPRVDDRDGTPLREKNGKPYGGCRVHAVVRLYPITDKAKGGAGIFADLLAVIFYDDDEAFGNVIDIDKYTKGLYEERDDDDDDDQDEDRGSRGRSSRRSSRDDRDDDTRNERSRSSRRSRDEEDEDEGDDRGSSRRGRSRGRADEDDDQDRGRSNRGRSSRRSRDEEDDDDDRGRSSRRSSRREVDDDDIDDDDI